MDKEKTTLEMIAPDVDEAIARGLAQLSLPREAVTVEVLDSGTKGIFGIGNRQARVRLSVIRSSYKPDIMEQPEVKDVVEIVEPEVVESKANSVPAKSLPESVEEDIILDVSRNVVEELLERMYIQKAQVKTFFDETDPGRDNDHPIVFVDINGEDLSILIGRRSETLNALQYIASLIVGKELGRWVHLKMDVQGYRARREKQLTRLANRMADQAMQTGRRQTLEPMPANERRLVHLALRENDEVHTESVGDEPYRKVTIHVKK
ncbi:MAG: Jag N-terminal domain-containing protein [Anaerolineaceae bacterium]|nr:Jag N-terminal domain-containing protein [Anaerolineaceae bacterium]